MTENQRAVNLRFKLAQSWQRKPKPIPPSEKSGAPERNPDVLRIQISQAETDVARLKRMSDAGFGYLCLF